MPSDPAAEQVRQKLTQLALDISQVANPAGYIAGRHGVTMPERKAG